MAYSYSRGHKIIYDHENEIWVYEDTLEPISNARVCKKCGKQPTPEGYDACMGHIPGAKSVCCGHGVKGKVLII